MKALILNSGLGRRMGVLTSEHPKCMTEITAQDTILSRQLRMLAEAGITDVVMTTGLFKEVLVNYCNSLRLPLRITFAENPDYATTNYIYSIYCARELLRGEDILLMHGDLVFSWEALEAALAFDGSCVTVSSTLPLPDKDFKAVIEGGLVRQVGVSFFNHALACQPLYKLQRADWETWLDAICRFCESGVTGVYAENALNEVSGNCRLYPLDVKDALCNEIDTPEDLAVVSARVNALENRLVYMCFSTDIIHSGHINIINRARRYGRLVIGVLSDAAVASYKRYPVVPFEERRRVLASISGVSQVVEQSTLSYRDMLRKLHPAFVAHGDDWKTGVQKPIRDEVVQTLAEYGGQLLEFPYGNDERYRRIEAELRSRQSIPDIRRGRLRHLLGIKPVLSILEAHDGITGLICERSCVYQNGAAHQFDGMWVSSLCDSTAKGKPDIEVVDMSSRLRTIDDICEVTTKPIILDGDTGGLTEHFVYTVRTLERVGVSAVIIEDKTGLKKNSLFGAEVAQTQDTIENFCEKLRAGKAAQKTREFMIIARIESLILEHGMEDALVRAFAYIEAGADGIMIHSRRREPDEIFEFLRRFREKDQTTPVVVVPTSFNTVTEEEFAARGANIVIYANQLTRSGVKAMQECANTILRAHRAKEVDDMCLGIQEVLTLIPEE